MAERCTRRGSPSGTPSTWPRISGRVRRQPPHPDGPRRQWEAIQGWSAFERLGEIAAPTLVLHGAEDRLIPVANAEVLASTDPAGGAGDPGGGGARVPLGTARGGGRRGPRLRAAASVSAPPEVVDARRAARRGARGEGLRRGRRAARRASPRRLDGRRRAGRLRARAARRRRRRRDRSTPADVEDVLDEPATAAASVALGVRGMARGHRARRGRVPRRATPPGARPVRRRRRHGPARRPLGRRRRGRVRWSRAPAGPRRATPGSAGHAAQIVLAVDGSIEPTGDWFAPLAAALEDATLGIAGPFGIVTSDLRQFDEAPGPGPCDAVEGYLMAFRRETLARRRAGSTRSSGGTARPTSSGRSG